MSTEKTAIVLGAYGLIGSACLRALKRDGFKVTGIGRSLSAGLQCDPAIAWLERDIATATAGQWSQDLAAADVVVNASGALQDGARDSLQGIHEVAISRLIDALSGSGTRFIQISAAGVSEDAGTEFMRSKMRGDNLLMASDLDWVILRPCVVIGAQAYGGTALLRASAALPVVGMRVHPEASFQTVYIEDVAQAVVQAARSEIATRTVADLTEAEVHSFQEVVDKVRAWLGYPEWRWHITMPRPFVAAIGRMADGLGWLGWRSPLRTTALRVLANGVTGDARAWEAAGGTPCRGLDDTLAALPATSQERLFGRMFVLLPLAVATLSVFWIASGVIGFTSREQAELVLTERGFTDAFAMFGVIGGAAIDLLLGCAILLRPWTRWAALGMIAVSAGYLGAATVWTPDLWADPLGPLVKVIPGAALALIVAVILEDR